MYKFDVVIIAISFTITYFNDTQTNLWFQGTQKRFIIAWSAFNMKKNSITKNALMNYESISFFLKILLDYIFSEKSHFIWMKK